MATEVGAYISKCSQGLRLPGSHTCLEAPPCWPCPAPARYSPGNSCSRLSLVRATSSWWVQSLVATMPSRPTLWVAVAWSWQVTSSEHLWELDCQGRAHLNTWWGGACGWYGPSSRPCVRPGDWKRASGQDFAGPKAGQLVLSPL